MNNYFYGEVEPLEFVTFGPIIDCYFYEDMLN